MYAIAFDLVVDVADALHPRGQQAAYREIERVLARRGFRRIQGSVYVTEDVSFAPLVSAMNNLRALPWFSGAVRDIRAFRVENWSDFTPFFKEGAS